MAASKFALPKVRRLSLALVACFAIAGTAAVSTPTQAAGAKPITLCIKRSGPAKGTIRFVSSATCRRSEERVQLVGGSDQGVLGIEEGSGEAGPQGPAGRKGDKGEKGDTGPQGIQGPKGETGATGPQGIQGETGPAGATRYLRVSGTVSATDATAPKTATVTCPEGRSVLSGGWNINMGSGGDPAEINIIQSQATSNATWTIVADEDNTPGASWSIQATAVCALVSS